MKRLFNCILITFQMFKLVDGKTLFPNMTILDMNDEQMTCIDFDTLNQLKNLEEIMFENGDMSYFPDKDCNNPLHEKDTWALDLPNVSSIFFVDIKLLKAPNSSLMPKLEKFILISNAIREIPENQFDNNGQQKITGFYNNDLTSAPVITSHINLDKLNLNYNPR